MDHIPDPSLMNGFAQIGCVRRRAAQNCSSEICHELDLTIRISRRHGQCQTAHLVGAAVEAKSAGEESVAVADLHNIFFCRAGSGQCARAALIPQVNIILCIESDDTASCGSRSTVDADTVRERSC